MMAVRVIDHCPAGAGLLPVPPRQIGRILDALTSAAREAGCPLGPVEAHLVDDACIARANQRYMGCTGPTNVLSFPGDESLPGVMLLSLDTLNRECLLYGQDPAEHLLRLLAHSVGHLAGYDHGEEMDALGQIDPHTEATVERQFEEQLDGFDTNDGFDGRIELTEYRPNYLKYRYSASGQGVAVFSEIYYDKGWKAYIDGVEAPYFRADYLLRGMSLPAGEHTVEWRFRAPDFGLVEGVTLTCSLIIIGGLVAVVAVAVVRRRKSRNKNSSNINYNEGK